MKFEVISHLQNRLIQDVYGEREVSDLAGGQ
jgi:hypothetical protein